MRVGEPPVSKRLLEQKYMYFYVDESGHTGSMLFDASQPTLYYGVLSSDLNLDVLAEENLTRIRKRLGVARLHAGELGNAKLSLIADDLLAMQKSYKLRFDFYRVRKPDHSIISFFDQVFDSAMNKAVAWSHYWTPMRYVTLLKLAYLFDEDVAKAAWAARIDSNKIRAEAGLVDVCKKLLSRVENLPDIRSRQIIKDALVWAEKNPSEISYNCDDKNQVKQISPNIVGFQFVMHGIANRIKLRQRQAFSIIVDRQTEFNQAQKTLAQFFSDASGLRSKSGPGMPEVDFSSMPKTPIKFVAGTDSAGLELVDVYLWIFKRIFEKREIAEELIPLFRSQLNKGRTDEVSLEAISNRWTQWFDNLPEVDEMTSEQLLKARKILAIQEVQRQDAMLAFRLSNNPTSQIA
jgi:hypothetical protein